MSNSTTAAETTLTASEATGPLRRGTLVYTRAGLAMLFIWLLWGDFCFTLMEQVIPSIMPLKLKALNTPNWLMATILTAIPTAMATVVSPVLGYQSDRLRTRWGRRIPFLFIATPFVALSLCLMAFSPEIGSFIHRTVLAGSNISPAAVIIGCIAVFMMGYKFFDLVSNLIFSYLLNDVVPATHLTRFYALFRIAGIVASASYNYFIFQFGESHTREVLLCAALLYFAGFMQMCWKLKEGEYPPPPETLDKRTGFKSEAKTYFKECFIHRIYWYYFLHTACWNIGGASYIFTIFLNLSLGVTLDQHGKILGVAQILTALLLYPAGMLADRLHPLRVMVWVKIGILASVLLNMIWLFKTFSPQTNFYILVGITALALPLNVMYAAAMSPMIMRLLPASRFGQFCSACFMMVSLFSILSGVAVGATFDLIRHLLPEAVWGKDYCYRFAPVWTFIFFSIGLVFLLLLFREWKRCGGDAAYKAPGFDN